MRLVALPMSNLWNDDDLLLSDRLSEKTERVSLVWLVAAAIATSLIWQLPIGNYLLYPFSILATWFHEMGHGLAALLLGGNFQQLQIFSSGSGFAIHSGNLFLGPIGRAIVAAAGPMAPPIVGGLIILASRRWRTTQLALLLLGGALILSTLIWVRSLFGLVAIPLLGILVLAITLYAPRWLQIFAVQLLGVQACISTYHQMDYLFTRQAVIGGRSMLSDSGQIAQNLLLPYWFWGALMAIASLIILVQSLRSAYR
jgi:Peptidase M50B-like